MEEVVVVVALNTECAVGKQVGTVVDIGIDSCIVDVVDMGLNKNAAGS